MDLLFSILHKFFTQYPLATAFIVMISAGTGIASFLYAYNKKIKPLEDALNKINENLDNVLDTTQDTIDILNAISRDETDQYKELKDEIIELKKYLNALNEKLDKEFDNNDATRQKHETYKVRLDEKIKKIEEKLESINKNLDINSKDLYKEINEIRHTLIELKVIINRTSPAYVIDKLGDT